MTTWAENEASHAERTKTVVLGLESLAREGTREGGRANNTFLKTAEKKSERDNGGVFPPGEGNTKPLSPLRCDLDEEISPKAKRVRHCAETVCGEEERSCSSQLTISIFDSSFPFSLSPRLLI